MEASTSVLSSPSSSPFPMSMSISSSPFASARKRKPVVTYQSPTNGILDVGLLVRNTTMQIEALAAAASSRTNSPTVPARTSPSPSSASSSTSTDAVSPTNSSTRSLDMMTRLKPSLYRTTPIPRPPPRLYHPFARPNSTPLRALFKSTSTVSSSSNHTPSIEPGRRSSSRTRRPAAKVRDTDNVINDTTTTITKERSTPAKRKRGGGGGGGPGGRRKKVGQERDEMAYVAAGVNTNGVGKRTTRKRTVVANEMDVDEESTSMPPPSPPSGYSRRAKKPRRGESSPSEVGTPPSSNN